MRIGLVSCVKTKLAEPAAAQDLYASTLFKAARCFVEEHCDRWFVLSAKHGLLHPSDVIKPYELTLSKMSRSKREMWGRRVRRELLEALPRRGEVVILAGERYRSHICEFLEQRGFFVSIPMAGKRFGEQLQWLREQIR